MFYDKKEKIQLRVFANVKIQYKNTLTKQAWGKTAHMSRQCYLGNKSPGSKSDIPTSGLAQDVDNSKYTIEESEIGYENFCVIIFKNIYIAITLLCHFNTTLLA